MQNKLNITRILTGGLIAGVAMLAIGFIIHVIILENHYLWFQEQGSVLKEPRPLGWIHFILGVLVGIPLAFLYAIGRNYLTPGPKAALIIGFLVGCMSLSGLSAEYAFYNLGGTIPLMTAVDNMLECITGCLIAGLLYKEN